MSLEFRIKSWFRGLFRRPARSPADPLAALRLLSAAGGHIPIRGDEELVTADFRAAERLGWCTIDLIETYHATTGSITITDEGRRQAS